MQTAPQFSWDSSIGKFIGPAQKSNLEKAMAETARAEEEKQVRDLKQLHGTECVPYNIHNIIHVHPTPGQINTIQTSEDNGTTTSKG